MVTCLIQPNTHLSSPFADICSYELGDSELTAFCLFCFSLGCSDHKPVFATFEVKPTPEVSSLGDYLPINVKLTNVKARNLRACDVNGKSDPYISCIPLLPLASLSVLLDHFSFVLSSSLTELLKILRSTRKP